jgi:hypothetical protein
VEELSQLLRSQQSEDIPVQLDPHVSVVNCLILYLTSKTIIYL